MDELEELFGTYEIYPLNYKNHKNVSYIKFDKEISDSNNFKDFMINNLINIYKLSTGLAFFKFKPDIFYGKLERSENIFNFPRINSNNSNFDNLIRDFSFEIYKKRLILKKFVSGHHNITNYFASEVTTKLTEINDFYYILFIPQTAKIDRTNLILFNKDFILSLNLYLDDDIKVCDYLTANYFTNIKKVIVINTDNDPESDWLNTFRIIYIDNNDMVDGIFMKENSKQVNLYKHRYLIDDEIFEENITIDLIDEKIYLIGDLDRKFFKDINLDETEVVDVINLFN